MTSRIDTTGAHDSVVGPLIVLEPELIDELRRKGAKRGLGYQTMLKVIVREHLDEY